MLSTNKPVLFFPFQSGCFFPSFALFHWLEPSLQFCSVIPHWALPCLRVRGLGRGTRLSPSVSAVTCAVGYPRTKPDIYRTDGWTQPITSSIWERLNGLWVCRSHPLSLPSPRGTWPWASGGLSWAMPPTEGVWLGVMLGWGGVFLSCLLVARPREHITGPYPIPALSTF